MKLNLGCGTTLKEGYINIDKVDIPGVRKHDIEKGIPFADNVIDEVLCEMVLEHIEYIPLVKDAHRVLKPGGRMIATVPHFLSVGSAQDPTHKHIFSIQTFEYFVKGCPWNYYFDFAFSRIAEARILFGRTMPYNFLLERLVNLHPFIQRAYEGSGVSRLFPPFGIYVVLEK